MMEETLRKTIEQFPDIIEFVEKFELYEEEHLSKVKVKLKLFDGSVLWIREIWIKSKIEVYSYYWLTPEEMVNGIPRVVVNRNPISRKLCRSK